MKQNNINEPCIPEMITLTQGRVGSSKVLIKKKCHMTFCRLNNRKEIYEAYIPLPFTTSSLQLFPCFFFFFFFFFSTTLILINKHNRVLSFAHITVVKNVKYRSNSNGVSTFRCGKK